MKDRFDIHQEITNALSPPSRRRGRFQATWHRAASTRARSMRHGSGYRGVIFCPCGLRRKPRATSRTMATFKQWQERGACVRKARRAHRSFSTKFGRRCARGIGVDGVEGGKTIPLRGPVGFSTHLRSMATSRMLQLCRAPAVRTHRSVDHAIAATGARIEYGGSRACYNRLTDCISIPDERAFFGTETSTAQEAFYSTILHELAHHSARRAGSIAKRQTLCRSRLRVRRADRFIWTVCTAMKATVFGSSGRPPSTSTFPQPDAMR